MRIVMIAILALAAPAALPARGRAPEGDAALTAIIAARVAAPSVDCIDPQQVRSTRIIAGTGIVYDTGRRLYVQRPQAGAGSLREDEVLVTRIDGGQLCRLDRVTLLEPVTRAQRGFLVLGAFVPYERRR